jgi:hypothetical protein
MRRAAETWNNKRNGGLDLNVWPWRGDWFSYVIIKTGVILNEVDCRLQVGRSGFNVDKIKSDRADPHPV